MSEENSSNSSENTSESEEIYTTSNHSMRFVGKSLGSGKDEN